MAEARVLMTDVYVAVIDLELPDGSGLDLIAELRETNPQAQAVVLTASPDRAQTAKAVERGAAACSTRACISPRSWTAFVDCGPARRCCRWRRSSSCCASPVESVRASMSATARSSAFTAREREVLQAAWQPRCGRALVHRRPHGAQPRREHPGQARASTPSPGRSRSSDYYRCAGHRNPPFALWHDRRRSSLARWSPRRLAA